MIDCRHLVPTPPSPRGVERACLLGVGIGLSHRGVSLTLLLYR